MKDFPNKEILIFLPCALRAGICRAPWRAFRNRRKTSFQGGGSAESYVEEILLQEDFELGRVLRPPWPPRGSLLQLFITVIVIPPTLPSFQPDECQIAVVLFAASTGTCYDCARLFLKTFLRLGGYRARDRLLHCNRLKLDVQWRPQANCGPTSKILSGNARQIRPWAVEWNSSFSWPKLFKLGAQVLASSSLHTPSRCQHVSFRNEVDEGTQQEHSLLLPFRSIHGCLAPEAEFH